MRLTGKFQVTDHEWPSGRKVEACSMTIISEDTIRADDGKHFVRKSDNTEFGKTIVLGYAYYINGTKLETPILETPSDFDEVDD